VLIFLGCCTSIDCTHCSGLPLHTIARLPWLAGLTISSVPGDLMSLMLSSLTWFSCASSSICGGVSPAGSQRDVAASTSVWSV